MSHKDKLEDENILSQLESEIAKKITIAYYVNPEDVSVFSFDLKRLKIVISSSIALLAIALSFVLLDSPEVNDESSDYLTQSIAAKTRNSIPEKNILPVQQAAVVTQIHAGKIEKVVDPAQNIAHSIVDRKKILAPKGKEIIDTEKNIAVEDVLVQKEAVIQKVDKAVESFESKNAEKKSVTNFAEITVNEAKQLSSEGGEEREGQAQTEVSVLISNLTKEKISGNVWAVASFEDPGTEKSFELKSKGSSVSQDSQGEKDAVAYGASRFTKKNIQFNAPKGSVLKEISVFVDSKKGSQVMSVKKVY